LGHIQPILAEEGSPFVEHCLTACISIGAYLSVSGGEGRCKIIFFSEKTLPNDKQIV
jgi:hypothetical protein